MPAYASGGWAPVDGIAAELQRFVDRGDFKAVKMRVGAGDGTLDHSIRRLQAARHHLQRRMRRPELDAQCDDDPERDDDAADDDRQCQPGWRGHRSGELQRHQPSLMRGLAKA